MLLCGLDRPYLFIKRPENGIDILFAMSLAIRKDWLKPRSKYLLFERGTGMIIS
jgi:hypothetical protein